MAKLTPESPRLFRPTLAAWIGLNESIFLEQLNFILTDTDKGRFADGRKWYRDTPRAFMIQYFPFWDESIVKRTIANLRADALILARSDLNDDHKDRSLWYTINYPTLERLDGPVARITGKSDKRKAARQARKTGADSQPEYTKVHFVLSSNKGTNSTLDGVQNVPLPQVQNVPTPKDSSSSLESYPIKESNQDSSPNGEVPPPLPKEEAIKVEYTTFLRDFLARFNAKRFRNPTQLKTVSDLVEQHGEAELESLAEWAANKGMGLGQAIPAIKSALKNPKRKAPDKSEDVPYVTPPDPIPPPARTPEQLIWQQVLADSPQIPQWLAAEIKPIPRSNGTFKLAVSSDSAKQWIDNRLVKVIKPTLNRIDQSISEIEVIVQ